MDLYDKGESLLISKPKNGVFSSLDISTLCKVAHRCTVCCFSGARFWLVVIIAGMVWLKLAD